jgi:hypothetical protein
VGRIGDGFVRRKWFCVLELVVTLNKSLTKKNKNCMKEKVNEVHLHLLTSHIHIVNCDQDVIFLMNNESQLRSRFDFFDEQWEQVIYTYCQLWLKCDFLMNNGSKWYAVMCSNF